MEKELRARIAKNRERHTAQSEPPATTPGRMTIPARGFGFLAVVFVLSSALLYTLVKTLLPELGAHGGHLPKTIEDLRAVAAVLARVELWRLVTVYVGLYVFLQTFAIPGSMMLSVLGGALFPVPLVMFLASLSSACGATGCYLISRYVASDLAEKYLRERIARWTTEIARRRSNLCGYMIFLRVTPLLPNWFINIASPHLDVPLDTFFVGTFVGVAPPTFLHVQAGATLEQLSSTGELSLMTWRAAGLLGGIALLVISPAIAQEWLRRRDTAVIDSEEQRLIL